MTRYTQFKSIVIQSSVSTFYCQAITVYSRILVKLAQVLLRRSSWHVLSFPFAVPVRLERSWCISNSVANSNAYMRTAIVQLWHCPIYIPLLVSSCKSFSKMDSENREKGEFDRLREVHGFVSIVLPSKRVKKGSIIDPILYSIEMIIFVWRRTFLSFKKEFFL